METWGVGDRQETPGEAQAGQCLSEKPGTGQQAGDLAMVPPEDPERPLSPLDLQQLLYVSTLPGRSPTCYPWGPGPLTSVPDMNTIMTCELAVAPPKHSLGIFPQGP